MAAPKRAIDQCRSAAEDSPLSSDEAEIRHALTQLVGLKLASAGRAADMRMFQFGTMRPAPKSDIPALRDKPRGLIGDFALHVQCPWRIETDNKILTGRSDLWEPVDSPDGFSYDDWDYEADGNLQDHVIEQFISNSDNAIVETIDTRSNGAFTLALNDGYALVVFPSGSVGEDWRFFRPGTDESHLVVSGGAIERDDS